MTTATAPSFTLNNGVEIPALGFGVFQTPPDETVGAVEVAMRDGYRLIDTAAAYVNEREVGEGIRRAGIARDDDVHRDEDLDQRLRLRQRTARVREKRTEARRRSDRPAPSASATAVGIRPHARRLPRAGETARRGQGARDRGQQLHARTPRAAAAPRRSFRP